jgi:hypothetical protein
MAELAKRTNPDPSLATLDPGREHFAAKGIAGEDIGPWDPCYIRNDGKIMRAIGVAAGDAAYVAGYAPDDGGKQNEPITLMTDVVVWYFNTPRTPGARVYLSATVAGGLSDIATTGGTAPIGQIMADGRRVQVWRNR